jgi:hypothetical protein
VAAERLDPAHAEKMARSRDLFTRHVRQVLIDNCLKCHGGAKTRSGFDLSTRELLLKGGDNGPALSAGKSKDSRLFKLVSHAEDPHMPPKSPPLTDEQLNRLAAWIDLGAAYDRPLLNKETVKKPLVVTEEDRRFWSFLPLGRPVPSQVKTAGWGRTPVDPFILARLEEKGLTPNPPADKRRLIRRAYFDLIGLPPTPEQVEAFLKDESPQAYEKVIDQLLASPHYGERWARHWLDIARFAESHGFEHDYDRPTAYHYRDFVIRALNQDLPYDTFVKWQIAGDELIPADPLAWMATGFLAAGVHSTQITINQVEKERYDELDDIVRTIGTGMLGLTVGCARCHDHKYDPVPTRDYYRMLSTFTTTVRSEQEFPVEQPGSREAKAQFDAAHDRLVAERTRYETAELPGKLDAWLAARATAPVRPRWALLDLASHQSHGGATFTRQDDGSVLLSGKNPDHEVLTLTAQTRLKGITAVRLEALAHPALVKGGPGRASNGNFALSDFRISAAPLKGGQAVPVKLVEARATFEQNGLPVRAAIDNDKVSAWAIDPQFGKDHAAVFEFEQPVGFDAGTGLTFTLEFNNNTGHGIGRPRLAVTTQARPVPLDGDQQPEVVTAILRALEVKPDARLSDWQRGELLKWFRTTDPQWQKLNRKVEDHAKSAPQSPKVKALICSEGVPPLRLHSQGADFLEQTHFLKRGDPNQKDGVAGQSFLQVLMRAPEQEKQWQSPPPQGSKTSYRRTALAAWITDVEQGAGHLLARVIVNRLWQHHFGRGLVATPSDFGFQGERPSHPELLDYLARDLIDHGWSLKHTHKLLMTSAVYMQGTQHDRAKEKVDPDNRLHWRRTPHRLEAEIIRDSLLAVSGLLDARMFGPGTLDQTHKRRSIYFFVKRSQLIPTMVLFDAPDTLQGAEQRTTTTIAPQALLMMNNVQVRQCATGFATRVAPAQGKSPTEAVQAAYLIALGRQATEVELKDSVAFVKEQTESYRSAGKANAEQLALTDFCQVLLGLNEFMYID